MLPAERFHFDTAMSTQQDSPSLPSNPLFHTPGDDGLYDPVCFVLVSERMRNAILSERRSILDALPLPDRWRQERLFARYDPQQRHHRYREIRERFERSGGRAD